MVNIANNDIFQDFAEEIKPRLPWAQILNPNGAGLSLKQIQSLALNYGFFITKDNTGLAGINTESILNLGWKFVSHEFQGGSEIVEGYLTTQLRFCVIARTETIVESDGVCLGYLFNKNSNTLSEVGVASKDNPKDFRRRSWWLIMLVDSNNSFINTVPIKLALSGATGAALTQELVKNTEETETGFFKASGQPVQGLSDLAKQMFIYDWTFAPCKPQNLAPYVYCEKRQGLVTEKYQITRYSSPLIQRGVTIFPVESISQAIFSLKSNQGQTLIELSKNCAPSFFDGFNKKVNGLTEPETEAEIEQQELVAEKPIDLVEEIKAIAGIDSVF